MKLIADKLEKSLFKTNFTLFTSPYKDNNILVLVHLNNSNKYFEIFRYIFDPTEPEVKFIKKLNLGQKLMSIMKNEIILDLILPGKHKDGIILFCKQGNVWRGTIKNSDTIVITERIGKIFLDRDNEERTIFDLFDFDDLVVYFTKRTKDFACLVIKERETLYLFLNTLLFSQIEEENSFIEFEDSFALWNSSSDNLDLFTYNSNVGISNIRFPQNKINKQIPLSIRNLKQIKNKPLDACVIGNNVYALDESNLYVFPNFNNIKKVNLIPFPEDPVLSWFEPHFGICVALTENGLFDFILSPTITEIIYRKLNTEGKDIKKIRLDKEYSSFSFGNKHITFVFKQNSCYAFIKQSNTSTFTESKIYIQKLISPIPDIKESLRRLQELDKIDLEALSASFTAQLPKGLLPSSLKSKRRTFSKEEDIFLVEHAYGELSVIDISKHLRRHPMSVYQRLRMNFDSPSCENHIGFVRSCPKCSNNLDDWRKISLETIKQKEYPKFLKKREEFTEEEIKQLLKREKKTRIRRQTIEFKKLLPKKLYEEIIEFIADTDITKGRSIYEIFTQSLNVFISDYLRTIDINNFNISDQLLKLFFSIKPNMSILRHIIKKYMKIVNPKFRSLGDRIFFYKDISILRELYNDQTNKILIPLLKEFYTILLKRIRGNIKEGFLAAIIYLAYKDSGKRITQEKISDLFNITEITLRTRVKNIQKLMSEGNFTKIIQKIMEIIKNNYMNYELIETEKKKLKNISYTLNNLLYNNRYRETFSIIENLNIKYREENIDVILPVIENISLVDDTHIICPIIEFIIRNEIYSQNIFNNFIKFIFSEIPEISQKVQKMIHHYYPELRDNDLRKLIRHLDREQKQKIFQYIQDDTVRSEKFKDIKDYLEEKLNNSG